MNMFKVHLYSVSNNSSSSCFFRKKERSEGMENKTTGMTLRGQPIWMVLRNRCQAKNQEVELLSFIVVIK